MLGWEVHAQGDGKWRLVRNPAMFCTIFDAVISAREHGVLVTEGGEVTGPFEQLPEEPEPEHDVDPAAESTPKSVLSQVVRMSEERSILLKQEKKIHERLAALDRDIYELSRKSSCEIGTLHCNLLTRENVLCVSLSPMVGTPIVSVDQAKELHGWLGRLLGL